jgi:hypothetical protein
VSNEDVIDRGQPHGERGDAVDSVAKESCMGVSTACSLKYDIRYVMLVNTHGRQDFGEIK